MNTSEYNGYKNYATWNIALWIGNDECIYLFAKEFARSHPSPRYEDLALELHRHGIHATPDGVRTNDPTLDLSELDALLEVI